MTRWWTCKHPTWSASSESRDTIPVSYAPGWHRGNGKRKSSVLEVWGQWPSCKRGGLGVQEVQFGTFVPPTHLLTKYPFPPKHDSNSLMVQIFSILLFYGTVSSHLWLKCQKNWSLASVHITLCLTWLWNLTKVLQEYYKVGCGTSLSTHKSNATKVLQDFKKLRNDTVNVFKLFILFCTRWF